MLRKIAIVGPESTGKTTLARQLAGELETAWVPEYARIYLEGLASPYEAKDLVAIAEGQLYLEESLARRAERFLICDTNLLVVKLWARDKFGEVPLAIDSMWYPKDYALHLLLKPNLPWEEDPLREDPERGTELFSLYFEELEKLGQPYGVVDGLGPARLEQALALVSRHFS